MATTPSPGSDSQGAIDCIDPGLYRHDHRHTGLMSVTITLAAYRENGILRRLRTTPVSPLVVMAAQVIVVFVMTCLGMLLLITAGKLVYHVRFEGNAFSVLGGFHPVQPEFLRDRIHPGGHHAHSPHCPDRRHGAALPDAVPLRRRLAARTDAGDRSEILGLPAADLCGQPAARPVDWRSLGRSSVGYRGPGSHAHPGNCYLTEDISVGVTPGYKIKNPSDLWRIFCAPNLAPRNRHARTTRR